MSGGMAERSERAGAPLSVSVVVPCFNSEAFIEDTLASALAQTRAPMEIIVVDDGSTDRSAEIAARFAVRVVRMEVNRGLSAALNAGIEAAHGDLIALLDSDDLWEPDHLEIVAGLLDRYPEAAVAVGAGQLFGEGTGVFYPRFPAGEPVDVFREALRTWVLLPTLSVIRRDAIDEAGGYFEDDFLANDFDLMLRISARHPFVCTHRITGHWRRHAGQLSSGQLRQIQSLYRARRRLLPALAVSRSGQSAGDLEKMTHQIWRDDLTAAWQDRLWDRFHTVLDSHRFVPGVRRIDRLRWKALGFTAPLVEHTWDRLPLSTRSAVKRLPKRLTVIPSSFPGR